MSELRLLGALVVLAVAWLALRVTDGGGLRRARRDGSGLSAGRWRHESSGRQGLGVLRRMSGGREDTGARWARNADLRPLILTRPERGRLCVGRSGGRLLATEAGTSLLVVGPTQSRKTSGLAIPALLEWEGPVVAASVKSDLARHTVGWRASRGETWIYDPAGSTGLEPSRWSPLDGAATWEGARRVARSLTEVARSASSGLNDGEFWYSTASKLLAPLFLAASSSGRSMQDVVRWLDEQEVVEVAEALDAAGELEALRAAKASWARDERQRSAVYTTAETVVEAFADPVVAGSCRTSETDSPIDPTRLLEGHNTLYLCAPAHDQRRLRPLFATLVASVVEKAFETAERRGCQLDPPLLVVLDEAANVAPVAELDVLASTAAGHGVQLVTVWQDLAQVSARYGGRATSVVNNHRAKVFLSGIADPQTLEHASQLIGDAELPTISTTSDAKRSSSTTRSQVTRRLLPADGLRRLGPGSAVLLYGHLPPAMIKLRPWYEDRILEERASTAA